MSDHRLVHQPPPGRGRATRTTRPFAGSGRRVTRPCSSSRFRRLVIADGDSTTAWASAPADSSNGLPDRRSDARTSNSPRLIPKPESVASMAAPADACARLSRANTAIDSGSMSGLSRRHWRVIRSTASFDTETV